MDKLAPKKVTLEKESIFGVDRCFEIEAALKELSSKTGHNLSYEIGYNLRLVSNVLKEWRERLEEYKNDKYEKSDEGHDLIFIVNRLTGETVKHEDGREFVLNPNNKAVEINANGKTYPTVQSLREDQTTAKRFPKDQTTEIDAALNKFKNETFEFNFKTFDTEDLEKAFKNGAFDGCNISYLFGVLLF